jgi:hypothetical protein
MVRRPNRTIDGAEVAGLRRRFQGQVLLPGQSGYDQARRVWNAMVDRRPALIARCASPADVVAAVGFARAHQLEIGVRCGGHSVLGISVPDGGLMVDLSPLGTVRVDPQQRRAWVGGGALLGDLDRATQRFGLATTAGNVSHTGVGGLTLGGGMGWLARRYGLACDNVTRFQLVTAGGEVLHVTGSEHPGLYWGLRGGGGNFGVVTEFEFTLHPVGTQALLVDLFYLPDQAPGPLRRWRDLIAEAPTQATLTAWAGTAGHWPFLPAELRGRPLASVGYVWVGDPDQGRGLLPALRSRTPAAERIQVLTYLELQRIDDDQEGHHLRRYWKGHYLRQLSDDAIAAFLGRGQSDGGDPGCCRRVACKATAARSPRPATTRPPLATATRWWSSSLRPAGPTRPRTRPASPRPGGTAPRSSRSPAASTSTTSPTKATRASNAPTAKPSWHGWRRSRPATTPTTPSTSTTTSHRERCDHAHADRTTSPPRLTTP